MTEFEEALEIAEKVWQGGYKPSVMVALSMREHNRRHVRLRRDAEGLYVRLGKRGQSKRYLSTMSSARVVSTLSNLVVFYE